MKMIFKAKKYNKDRSGIVMIITIITLVVLAAMLYTLGSRLLRKSHRDQYIIDYQNARYACDSGTKYALAVIGDFNTTPISRPNEPDFSDLFQMTQEEYDLILEEYKIQLSLDPNFTDSNMYGSEEDSSSLMKEPEKLSFAELLDYAERTEESESNSFDANTWDANSEDANAFGAEDGNAFDNVYIRGPYGPKWPLVQEPIEFEIGTSKVVIEIEDENAKLPVTWALMDDEKYNRQAKVAVKSFLEWMQVGSSDIETLQKEFERVKEIKAFSPDMNSPVITTAKEVPVKQSAAAQRRSKGSRRRSKQAEAVAEKTRIATEKMERNKVLNLTDFSKISNSLIMYTEILERPAIESLDRIESAYKYIGLWGNHQVNINTAPRHVLEAAFTFGGDEAAIADEIIRLRKIKPFDSIEELSKVLYQYNDTIDKSKPFIITRSNVFTVRITAYSGTSTASVIAAVLKEEKSVQNIVVILK